MTRRLCVCVVAALVSRACAAPLYAVAAPASVAAALTLVAGILCLALLVLLCAGKKDKDTSGQPAGKAVPSPTPAAPVTKSPEPAPAPKKTEAPPPAAAPDPAPAPAQPEAAVFPAAESSGESSGEEDSPTAGNEKDDGAGMVVPSVGNMGEKRTRRVKPSKSTEPSELLPPATDPTKETQRVRHVERPAVNETMSWDALAQIDNSPKVVTIKKAGGGRRSGSMLKTDDEGPEVRDLSELPPAIVPLTSFKPATIKTEDGNQ